MDNWSPPVGVMMSPNKRNASASKRRPVRTSAASRGAAKENRRDLAGARLYRTGLKDRLASYRSHHKQVALDSLRRLLQRPLASAMTSLVLAIAMALPAGLYVALNNLVAVSDGWEGASRVSLFLNMDVDSRQGSALRDRLAAREDIKGAVFISAEAALEEFRERSGFGEVLEQLDDNPLPGLIVITPASDAAADVDALQRDLSALPEADQVKLDMAWLQRLNQLTELARKMTLALAAMLGAGVLLILGNTIKLAIENRRDEILVVKLVGGTNAFVRRPFLYMGLWYGLAGGVLGWLLVQGSLLWLKSTVAALSSLYGSDFSLMGLGIVDTLLMWILAAGLGLLGAALVVGRELAAIEPR